MWDIGRKQGSLGRLMGGAMCAALLLAACSSRKPMPPQDLAAPDSYRITAGDTVEVIVWNEPQVSGPVQVRADGMITLPLLGDVQAAGTSPEELGETIRQGLTRFIDGPNVVVRLSASSQRYFMIGNVASPGMYELRPNLTLLQAVAIAKGLGPFADSGAIRIIRPASPNSPLEPDYDAIIKGKQPDVLLRNNDTIVVP